MSKNDDDAPPNERRAFMRKAATVAVGAGVLMASGKASAAAALKKNQFKFSTNIAPAALTTENIAKITDAVAAALAGEAKAGMEVAPQGFHLRVGGGHSREFSKTPDHKNVGHSEVIIGGSFP